MKILEAFIVVLLIGNISCAATAVPGFTQDTMTDTDAMNAISTQRSHLQNTTAAPNPGTTKHVTAALRNITAAPNRTTGATKQSPDESTSVIPMASMTMKAGNTTQKSNTQNTTDVETTTSTSKANTNNPNPESGTDASPRGSDSTNEMDASTSNPNVKVTTESEDGNSTTTTRDTSTHVAHVSNITNGPKAAMQKSDSSNSGVIAVAVVVAFLAVASIGAAVWYYKFKYRKGGSSLNDLPMK